MKDYNKKIKLYEMFGALKFQKVVFKIEKYKYKVLSSIYPNYTIYYEKICDKRRDKNLKRCKSEEKKRIITNHYMLEKLRFRKEVLRKENRNYHININEPTEFIKYLNWNKKVHKNGLIKNGVLIIILFSLMSNGILPLFSLFGIMYEFVSAGINFECINLQNYNICRFKQKEEKLRKIEDKKTDIDLKKYGAAIKVIGNCLENSKDIPLVTEVEEKLTTKEQLLQMRTLLNEIKRANKNIVTDIENKKGLI